MWLALRALFWTLVCPGVFGFYLPWRYFGLRDVRIDVSNPRQWFGMLCIDVGTILLLACIWEFARRGQGHAVAGRSAAPSRGQRPLSFRPQPDVSQRHVDRDR